MRGGRLEIQVFVALDGSLISLRKRKDWKRLVDYFEMSREEFLASLGDEKDGSEDGEYVTDFEGGDDDEEEESEEGGDDEEREEEKEKEAEDEDGKAKISEEEK